jgi:hypothetical protein
MSFTTTLSPIYGLTVHTVSAATVFYNLDDAMEFATGIAFAACLVSLVPA